MALRLGSLGSRSLLAPCPEPWEARLEPGTLGSLELPSSALTGIRGCHALGASARRKAVRRRPLRQRLLPWPDTGRCRRACRPRTSQARTRSSHTPRDAAGPLQTPFGGREAHSCAPSDSDARVRQGVSLGFRAVSPALKAVCCDFSVASWQGFVACRDEQPPDLKSTRKHFMICKQLKGRMASFLWSPLHLTQCSAPTVIHGFEKAVLTTTFWFL